ncbi:hypothetical protein MMC22_007893 [Lobaria immixta]|nr:hypothetical protein [Lobaria immixta]
MSFEGRKETSENVQLSYAEVHHVEGYLVPVMPDTETAGRPINLLLTVACIAVGGSSFIFGFDNQVRKYQGVNPTTGQYVFTARNQDLVFSVPLVGSIIGALLSPVLNTHYGRKWTLIGSYFLSVGGAFLQLFAPNLAGFVIGRFWNSFVTGIAGATAPLYLSEIVPSSMRGRAVTLSNVLALVAGVLATLVVFGTHANEGKKSYMIPLGVQCVMPVILIPMTIFVPESPQWLASKDRMDQARQNLRRVRGWSDSQVDDELRVMKMCEDNERALSANVKFWNIFDRENIKRTITAGSFYSFSFISGIILSTTYATVFLEQLGVGSPYTLTVIASCCVLAGTLVALFTVDRAGRRPMALVGMVILLVIDVIAGALAFDTGKRSHVLAIAALSFIFNFFWGASFYSLSTLLPAEIATPKLRNYTMSYAIAWSETTSVIMNFVVPQLTAADAANLGAKTYLVFAGCMVCILAFVFFLLPETRGRTFAEIDEMYDAKIPMWRWRKYETKTEAKQATIVPVDVFQV